MSKVLVSDGRIYEATQTVSHEAAEAYAQACQPAEAEGVERWSELSALAESAPGENWKAGNAYGKPFIPTYQVIADTVDGPCVILEGNKNFIEQAKAAVTFAAAANPAAVRELIAALSAVTAERDRLREEMAELWKRIDKFQSQSHGITALAEIERLRAEVEALRVALLGIASVNPAERGIEWAKAYASDGLSGTGSELYNRWLETFKEADAVRKDAERYRWLRGRLPGSAYRIAGVIYSEGGDGVDAAVDAAMATKEA